MENHILADRIANAIMMDDSFKGCYLIVEGEKDFRIYNKFIDESSIKIKEAFGCEKVKLVLQILTERGYSNKLGIIDADFSRILNVEPKIDGLFITDYHDIEVIIFKTKALETVLRTFISKIKLNEFEKQKGKSIREILFEIGAEIGFLKLANKIYDLGLIFKPHNPEGKQIDYKEFVVKNDFSYSGKPNLIKTAINYSRSKSKSLKSEEDINIALETVSTQSYNIDDLINGHDLSNILFLLLKKTLGSKNKMLHDFNSIEDCLALAFEYEDFKHTNIYNMSKAFAITNGVKLWR